MYAKLLLLCLFLLPFAFSSPVEHTARDDVLAKATKNYQGINWDRAYGDCGGSRFNTLVEATRMAIQLTKRPSQPVNTPGWNRFFLSDKHIKKREGWIGQGTHYWKVLGIMDSVHQFPSKGKDRNTEKRIMYRCDGRSEICRQRPGAAAVTALPTRGDSGKWEIHFCDRFWAVGHLNDKRRRNSPQDLETLKSFEHVIAHELLHCGVVTGSDQRAVDKRAFLPSWPTEVVRIFVGVMAVQFVAEDTDPEGQDVYGASRCSEYAWLYADKKKANFMVKENADNYAWFYTNNWFNDQWKWHDDGERR